MKKDLYNDNKTVHFVDKIHPAGSVSACCYKRPKPINSELAKWTVREGAVTCRKCLVILNIAAKDNDYT